MFASKQMHTQMLYDLSGCYDGFLRLYHVLNFLLAPFMNLPPAHNRIISLVFTHGQYLSPTLSPFSRSLSYCVSQHTAAAAPSSSPYFTNSSLPLCLFRMNSGLHCRMAACYDSRLLLTVFGLGGGTHTYRRPAMHTHTQGQWHLHLHNCHCTWTCSYTCTHSCESGISFSRWSSSPPCLKPYFDCLLRISLYLAIVKPAWLCEYIQKHVWCGG